MEEQTSAYRILPASHGAGLSCAEVRATVSEVLAGLNTFRARVDDVLTVATEMISNASRHAGGATVFQITARAGAVTVKVSDRSPDPPRIQPWAPEVPGGFGWRLVNQLATTHVHVHLGGKTVTATLTTAAAGPA
ncbi:ATP-binding protein [Streptomyces sp. NPDC056254]|uniref:ATP-binding protein n=1 Tax=Streptomyces sp. NPDC056254 TaxID=3345763 RepID=UPI0035E137DA